MPRFYTGAGDSGYTGIIGVPRMKKSDRLIEAIGAVDELNSAIGVALAHSDDAALNKRLKALQNELFIVGAELASSGAHGRPATKRIVAGDVKALENGIAKLSEALPELRSFVLPGGTDVAAHLHMARAIARRAERTIVDASEERTVGRELLSFMNRVSSFLFVAALYTNRKRGAKEDRPTY